jgi:hypothetical protein
VPGAFAEELRCGGDIGSSAEEVAVDPVTQAFGVGDRGSDLAVIQVRGKGDEACRGQPVADGLDGGIQPPPGVQDGFARSVCESEAAIG